MQGFGPFGLLSSSFKHSSVDFLINPSSLRWGSASLHLGLILGVFTSRILRKIRMGMVVEPSHRTLVSHCFMVLALYNCGSCCFDYLRNGVSDANLVIILDYFVRSLACLAMYIYLHKSRFPRFPVLLRVWWGLYFAISCYCLVIDLVGCTSQDSQFIISDFVYVITGLIFCYAGVFGKETAASLEEPLLLNNNNNDLVGSYASAGFLSILTFSWITPLISTGCNKVLDLEDVPELAAKDSVKGSFPAFKTRLDCDRGERQLTALQLYKSLIYTAWGDILWTGVLALIYTLAAYVGPYLIEDLVQFLNGRRRYEHEGYALVSAFFVGKLVECIAQRHWLFGLQRVGVRLRSALMTLIYSKSLTIKQGHSTSGEMVNLMAVDAPTVIMSCCIIHNPWLAFIQVILALLILYKNLGWATLVALFATVLVMLVNYPLGNILKKAQGELMKSKDKRMKATTEILKNMRILKLQAWEIKFLSKISQLRESEAGCLKTYLYINASSSAVFWVAPTFVSVATFVACLLMGIPLQAGKILSAIATFSILSDPIYSLPGTVSMFLQAKVSLDRIASYLRLEDLKPDAVERLPRAASEAAIEVSGGAFDWDHSSYDPTLKDINIRISHGMRVAVCGTVGSGKSSLLSCMLGEIPKASGTIRVSGSVAYVAQSAWIQSGRIVDNVLFGSKMDRGRYETVLEACSLKKDLEALPFGDQTIIGERGINLSGGQKQRIQIARALYQDADIYLLDDPFSAVDAHTGTHLFKECLLGLLESKTVVFVTHQVEFLPAVDIILVMKDGRISQAGKYDDILSSGSDFMELVGAHEKALASLDSGQTITPSTSTIIANNGDEKASRDQENDDPTSFQPGRTDDKQKAQLVQEEEREKGKVSFRVYWKYITAAYGGALVPFILLAHISFQTLQVGSNYWMAWATPVSAYDKPAVDATTLIAVFVAFGIGGAICILLRETLLSTAAYKTATIIFDKMLYCIFCAPMSFFDATPSGRILTRASTDQNNVDTVVPREIGGFAFSTIQLLATVGIMSQVAWQIFIIFIPIACLCVYYQQYYSPASRELFRLVGVSRAPVIQHFSESISGTTTIRGFNQQCRFQDRCMELIDGFSRSYFHISATQEWLCFRLDLLSSLTFACSLVFLISIPAGVIDTGIAGLGVTYGLSLNMLQAAVIWHLCQLGNKITSVERILQYTNVPSEGRLFVEANKPAPSWPSRGVVNIRDLQVRYAPHLPMVLQGITCTFHGGKKTGIVGRTGSGKSTLIQALFRIVEPASGRIVIDGVDISMIGLHDLRSRLSIIPQDPTMFEGTIRNNLDPLGEYTDEQIWEVIDKCQLDEVRNKEGKLDSLVAENGENWSMGQRQLVCLARVLLKKSKILVLDEATAVVDTATDNLIQKTIRQHFSDSTVLIIAHRITSVLDSDRVLVLRQGLVEEFDSPTRLLEDSYSSFAKLVAEYTSRSISSQR